MERKKLSQPEIEERLNGLDGWKAENNHLKKRFTFKNFAESLSFVNKAGEIAEKLNHHPDITFGWGYAEIATTTHDRDGVTDVDLTLAAKIDQIATRR